MVRAIGADLQGSTISLDGLEDRRANRKAIFEERFRAIERVFAWAR
jgi:hypothetical protein